MSSDRPLVGKRSLTGFGNHHPHDGNRRRASADIDLRLDRGQPTRRASSSSNAFVNRMGQHGSATVQAMRRLGE